MNAPASVEWLLLIYSLPSQPSRKRAYVWRELKRLGAIYLRDGVALLPRSDALEQRLEDVATRIREYDGEVQLVLSPRFSTPDPEQFTLRFQQDRTDEYRELYHGCVHFLRDVLEDVDSEDFGFPDVDKLESELARLQRWRDQIRERDYFAAPGLDRVDEMLGKCERAFEAFVSHASDHEKGPASMAHDDVFERLAGPPADESVDLPL